MTDEKAPFWREPWTLKAPAFAITDCVFYVGKRNVACHLLRSAQGWVLVDTAFAQTTYLLTESLRTLGVDPGEISMILHTHGHVDHCGATRRLKELSGATVAIGEADVETVECGTPLTCAEYLYGIDDFETFKVDRALRHGDSVDLGDLVIGCHHTPGHTPGVMTYTFPTEVDGRCLTVGLFGGPGMWTLVDQHRDQQGYPQNRRDFSDSLKYLRTLEVDLWLGAHPGQNDTFGKWEQLRQRETPNPFIDREGWRQFIRGIDAEFGRICGTS